MRYLAIIETDSAGYAARSPDFDVLVATGATCEEAMRKLGEAIERHLSGFTISDALTAPFPPEVPTGGV